jgi:hypothetical protein
MIKEVVVFGYATEGEALVVANQVPKTQVAKVHILRGLTPAKEAVAFLVVSEDYFDSDQPSKRK